MDKKHHVIFLNVYQKAHDTYLLGCLGAVMLYLVSRTEWVFPLIV